MNALNYLFLTSVKNKGKRALKKPITYFYVVLGGAYIAMLIFGLGNILRDFQLIRPEVFAFFLSVMTLMFTAPAYATYAKRKGVLFRPSDVHLVFTAPFNPKMVLLYVQYKNHIINAAFSIGLGFVGFFGFHISALAIVSYILLSFLIDNCISISFVILLYGNERFSEKTIKWFGRCLYLVPGLLLAFGAFLYFTGDGSFLSVVNILSQPLIQCVPIVGWNVAFIRLMLLGPTTLNIICTLLYFASALILILLAKRMKCKGEYYEDAMKFADDYQEIINRKKSGDIYHTKKPGSFRKASVLYKGGGAKAIFYKQILEYKKHKFFVFGGMSLFILGVSVFLCYITLQKDLRNTPFALYVIPIAASYITLCLSGYKTKWQKEMENPITYLIPDTPVKKLWYATLMEHVKAFADGILLSVPAGIFLKLSIPQIICMILIYVFIQATKLYLMVITEALLGNILGAPGKTILKLLGQSAVFSIVVIATIAAEILGGSHVGLIIMTGSLLLISAILLLIGSNAYKKMEALG